MQTEQRFALVEHALFQKVVDETVILDSQTGQYYTLDSVATEMVERLNQGNSIAEVVTAMSADYDASEATIEQDLKELATEMRAKGLLVERQA